MTIHANLMPAECKREEAFISIQNSTYYNHYEVSTNTTNELIDINLYHHLQVIKPYYIGRQTRQRELADWLLIDSTELRNVSSYPARSSETTCLEYRYRIVSKLHTQSKHGYWTALSSFHVSPIHGLGGLRRIVEGESSI